MRFNLTTRWRGTVLGTELTEELFNLRFQLSMGVAKNPSRVGQARRDLARIQTILRERRTAKA